MSWRLRHDFKRKQKLREQEEKRRQRLLQSPQETLRQESENKFHTDGITSSKNALPSRVEDTPISSDAAETPISVQRSQNSILRSQSSSLRRQQSVDSTSTTFSTASKRPRVSIWSPPSALGKPIDPKWLDSPKESPMSKATKTKLKNRETPSREWNLSLHSSQTDSDDDKWTSKPSTPAHKAGKKAKASRELFSPVRSAPGNTDTPPNKKRQGICRDDDDDDDDTFGDDLFAEFRLHLKSKDNTEKAKKQSPLNKSSKRNRVASATKTGATGNFAPDSAILDFIESFGEQTKRSTSKDELEEFTQTQDDPIEDSEEQQFPQVDDNNSKRQSSSQELGYGGRETTENHKRSTVPRNPIALEKQESLKHRSMYAINAQNAANSRDDLWSDSEPEGHETSKVTTPKRKRSTGKSKMESDIETSTPTSRGLDDELLKCSVLQEYGTALDDNSSDIGQILHPIMESPKFGPFALEPIQLENGKHHHEIPAALSRYLAPFQQDGIKFMHKCLTSDMGTVLGDDMGCGKTVQVLGLLLALFGKVGTGQDVVNIRKRLELVRMKMESERQDKEAALQQGQIISSKQSLSQSDLCTRLLLPEKWWPVLIVVPPTLVENWKNEFSKFTHFSVAYYVGNQRDLELSRLIHGSAEILLTTKALFQQAASFQELNSIPHKWRLIVIDEYHTWKSFDSLVATNLRAFKKRHKNLVLGMTGTLMSNNHKELWNLIDMVETNYLGGWDEFRTQVADPIKLGRTKTASKELITISNEKARALREKLRKIFIERSKEDVLRQFLPEKKEKLVLCELSPLQKQVYQHLLTLPDYELVKRALSPCDCGVNLAFFQRVQRLHTPAERVSYYREHKNDIITKRECCYKVPVNPRYVEGGTEPYIDPNAALWKMIKAHEDGEECKMCPFCCGLPALTKLYKLADHLAMLQTVKLPGSEEVGSPDHETMTKELEFSKVALPPDIIEQLPGKSYFRKDGIMDNHFALSGKLKVLDRLLKSFSLGDSRVLLFSYSTQTLDLIQNYLRAAGHSHLRMDGGTSSNLRQAIADQFNRDPTIFVFLLSTKAMGTGLNLTSANKVIIFNSEWNPSNDEQAQDRAYRIGQERDVEVLRLVAQGTIDELKYLRQLYKVQLKQETLLDDASSMPRAARMFRGVAGDKSRKGELFGYENLFRFKDGKFLDDIWKQTGKSKATGSRIGDLEMHEASRLTSELLKLGNEKVDELLNKEASDELEALTLSASQSVIPSRDWFTGNRKEKAALSQPDTRESPTSSREATQEIEAQALNHKDLFREDRGRAAIMEGEEGFDEEMGGATQNIFEIYEEGVEMPDNPQDASMDDAEQGDVQEESNSHAVPLGHRSAPSVPIPDPTGNEDNQDDRPRMQARQQLAKESKSATRNGTVNSLVEPEWIVDSDSERSILEGNTKSDVASKSLARATTAKTSRDQKSNISTTSMKRTGTSRGKPVVNLFGISSNTSEKKGTTFSVGDLKLPVYKTGKSKRKKTRR